MPPPSTSVSSHVIEVVPGLAVPGVIAEFGQYVEFTSSALKELE